MATLNTFGPASLITDDRHRLYHIEAGNNDLAHAMIDVGDPHRAEWFAQTFFKGSWKSWEHRGHVFATGKTKNGYPLSVVTTAMGVGSTDIIATEQIAAHVLDLPNRRPKKFPPKVAIGRLGTCGALQEDAVLGMPIVTTGAIGLDSTGLYIEQRKNRFTELAQRISDELAYRHGLNKKPRAPRQVFPSYAAPTSPKMVKTITRLVKERGIDIDLGITITASGFYHTQGRSILPGVRPAIPNLDRVIAAIDPTIRNFEMEIAVIAQLALLSRATIHAGCICIPVAHRPTNRFMENLPVELPKRMEAAGELWVATMEAMYDSGDITPH